MRPPTRFSRPGLEKTLFEREKRPTPAHPPRIPGGCDDKESFRVWPSPVIPNVVLSDAGLVAAAARHI
eukprot:747783-Hanusia_phi.AAC.1